jgi:hypothetical protein
MPIKTIRNPGKSPQLAARSIGCWGGCWVSGCWGGCWPGVKANPQVLESLTRALSDIPGAPAEVKGIYAAAAEAARRG